MKLSRRNFLLGTSAVVAVAALPIAAPEPEYAWFLPKCPPLSVYAGHPLAQLPWRRMSWDEVPKVWGTHFYGTHGL